MDLAVLQVHTLAISRRWLRCFQMISEVLAERYVQLKADIPVVALLLARAYQLTVGIW